MVATHESATAEGAGAGHAGVHARWRCSLEPVGTGGGSMTVSCLWCEASLPPGRGRGSERRFCCAGCRSAFHTAARQWAVAEVLAGRLTVARLKKCGLESVHACSRAPDASVPSAGAE